MLISASNIDELVLDALETGETWISGTRRLRRRAEAQSALSGAGQCSFAAPPRFGHRQRRVRPWSSLSATISPPILPGRPLPTHRSLRKRHEGHRRSRQRYTRRRNIRKRNRVRGGQTRTRHRRNLRQRSALQPRRLRHGSVEAADDPGPQSARRLRHGAGVQAQSRPARCRFTVVRAGRVATAGKACTISA